MKEKQVNIRLSEKDFRDLVVQSGELTRISGISITYDKLMIIALRLLRKEIRTNKQYLQAIIQEYYGD